MLSLQGWEKHPSALLPLCVCVCMHVCFFILERPPTWFSWGPQELLLVIPSQPEWEFTERTWGYAAIHTICPWFWRLPRLLCCAQEPLGPFYNSQEECSRIHSALYAWNHMVLGINQELAACKVCALPTVVSLCPTCYSLMNPKILSDLIEPPKGV